MKLKPLDIKKQQFKKIFRGLDPAEVETFLSMIASELEECQAQNKELTHKLIEVETQLKDYKSVEKAIQDTFMQAQETTGKAIENARKEAQLIIQEAGLKASQIVDKARNEQITLKEHITILKAKKDSIVSRLKMLLNSELELIKTLEIDEELQARDTSNRKLEFAKEELEIEEIIKSLDQTV
jgi:cell division initiation protein